VSDEIRIVDLDDTSITRVVGIHARAFPGFYLSELGAPFLGAYYMTVLEYRRGILLGAYSGDSLIGFVAGYMDPSGFHIHMNSRRRRFLAPLLLAVVRKPCLMPRTLYNLKENRRLGATTFTKMRAAELSSLAVSPEKKGRGVGRVLVAAFVERAGSMGAEEVLLTTDSNQNEAVNRFYLGQGFELVRTIAAGAGRTKNLYRRGVEKSGV